MKAIWLTWERQRRNAAMAAMMGAEYQELLTRRKGLLRYAVLATRTLWLLASRRPGLIFCQNPSLVLAALCVAVGLVTPARVIVDEHNAGLFPLEGQSKLLNRIAAFVVRHADAVFVSNHELTAPVERMGGTAIVCPDPLPTLNDKPLSPELQARLQPYEVRLLVICSWATDEPYQAIVQAARQLPDHFGLFFTGRAPKHVRESELPSNVHLLGFIATDDYDALVRAADGLVVLSTRESCLNCGAYEALAAGVPAVVSDTTALRHYFPHGFEHAHNDPETIAERIRSLVDNRATHVQKMADTQSLLTHRHGEAIESVKRGFAWPPTT